MNTLASINSPITIIKASAGAGKTYELSLHFLRVLNSLKYPSYKQLRKVVAITFTNKAAAEMKSRILLFLKHIALETKEGKTLAKDTGLTPIDAGKWLDTIIENFSDFHVRTIDSLLFSIFKGIGFELNFPPDMEVEFFPDELVELGMNAIFMEGVKNPDYKLIQLLDTYLKIDRKGGFYPEKSLKKRLTELYGMFEPSLKTVELDYSAYILSKRELKERYLEFYQVYENTQNFLNKNKTKNLSPELLEDDIIKRKFWQNEKIEDLLTKKGMKEIAPSELARLDEVFSNLKKAALNYQRNVAKLSYYQLSGYVPFLKELDSRINEIMKREGISLSSKWTKEIKDYLKSEATLPLVYSYFGSWIEHFLFDEFQDTSKEQWEALFPLFEEALSKGGSLFVVGDIKQAIYRWRGGDWTLFEEIKNSFSCVDSVEEKVLRYNYRSCPDLVEFFNKFFSPLLDRDWLIKEFSQTVLGKNVLPSVREWFVSSITKGFYEHAQRSKKHISCGGEVKFYKISADSEDVYLLLQKHLIEKITALWEQVKSKKNTTQIGVLVRTNDQAKEVSSWLLERNLPVITENSLNLWTSSAVKGIVCFLKLLMDRDDEVSLYGFWMSGLMKEGPENEKKLLLSWLKKDANYRHWLENTFEYIEKIQSYVSYVSCYELVRLIMDIFNIEQRFNEDLEQDRVFLKEFLELTLLIESQRTIFLEDFIEKIEQEGLNIQIGLPEGINAIRVITIHKAKGLEFPYVFIPYTNWSVNTYPKPCVENQELIYLTEAADYLSEEVKYKRQRQIAEEAQELLNLFYVAATRAKKGLYCYLLETKKTNRSISVWIEELIKKSSLSDYVINLE